MVPSPLFRMILEFEYELLALVAARIQYFPYMMIVMYYLFVSMTLIMNNVKSGNLEEV
jgi:hypothetical protein